jgi:hypothetical protein
MQLTNDDEMVADFKENAIILFIPKQMITALADTDEVGFENVTGEVHLLVEKDFTCLDSVAEDQRDHYPNPLAEKRYEQKN